MDAVLYARVSSDRQDVDLSISAQLKALRDYADRNGYFVVKEYVDEAESGRSIDRPGFKAMIGAARQKSSPFEVLLVWKLSRFARNREDSIIYKSLLRKHGVQVVSINEPVEDTPSGRLLEGIIEVIDEFYSANLSQDVVRGMRENASRGFFTGGTVPYGFKRVNVRDGGMNRTKLEPDPSTAPVVGRIFRECLEGQGLKEIAKGLNGDRLTTGFGKQWSPTSVHNVLRNEAYVGTMVWDRHKKRRVGRSEAFPPVRVERAWPGIIDQHTFEESHRKMAARAPQMSHPRVVDSRYLLSGMIRCKQCGAAMTGMVAKSGQFFYYACNTARRKGRLACNTPLLPKQKVEAFVVDRIKDNILTTENLEALVTMANEELLKGSQDDEERIQILQARIDEAENRLGKLYDALETGAFEATQLAPRIASLTSTKEELEVLKSEAEVERIFPIIKAQSEY
ncbi:MAG: recombinase family protein [Acidobacteria bacterium]|nr:recombinase family protein [Acidobacteriota bacterium]